MFYILYIVKAVKSKTIPCCETSHTVLGLKKQCHKIFETHLIFYDSNQCRSDMQQFFFKYGFDFTFTCAKNFHGVSRTVCNECISGLLHYIIFKGIIS